jgi:hypothetical protein
VECSRPGEAANRSRRRDGHGSSRAPRSSFTRFQTQAARSRFPRKRKFIRVSGSPCQGGRKSASTGLGDEAGEGPAAKRERMRGGLPPLCAAACAPAGPRFPVEGERPGSTFAWAALSRRGGAGSDGRGPALRLRREGRPAGDAAQCVQTGRRRRAIAPPRPAHRTSGQARSSPARRQSHATAPRFSPCPSASRPRSPALERIPDARQRRSRKTPPLPRAQRPFRRYTRMCQAAPSTARSSR